MKSMREPEEEKNPEQIEKKYKFNVEEIERRFTTLTKELIEEATNETEVLRLEQKLTEAARDIMDRVAFVVGHPYADQLEKEGALERTLKKDEQDMDNEFKEKEEGPLVSHGKLR